MPEQRRQLSAIVAAVQAARGEAIEDRSAVDADYEVIDDDAPEEWELAYEEVNA